MSDGDDLGAPLRRLGFRLRGDAVAAFLGHVHKSRLGPTETVEQLVDLDELGYQNRHHGLRDTIALDRGVGGIGGVPLAIGAGRATSGGDSLVLGAGGDVDGGDSLVGASAGGGDLLVVGAGGSAGGGDSLAVGAGGSAGGGDSLAVGAGGGAGGGSAINEIRVPSTIQAPREVVTMTGIRCNRLAKTWVSSGHAVTRWETIKALFTQPGPKPGGVSDSSGVSIIDLESGWTFMTVSPFIDTTTR